MFPDRLQRELAHGNTPIRLVQLTDCHLEQDEGGQLLGMDTDNSLAYVLELVREHHPDLVVATGDLANHGSIEAYKRFHQQVSTLQRPVFWLAGNHDQQDLMEEVANDGRPLPRRILLGRWQILLLDSTVPGEVGGTLGEAEIELLRSCLQERPLRHTLVCLHHHPVPIGCDWLDEQMVTDADALFELLDQRPEVKGLLWGHVHQELDRPRNHLRLMCSPSTCIQFAPGSEKFAVEDKAPGFRWLTLHTDGSIDTGVRRVEGVTFDFDADSNGYL